MSDFINTPDNLKPGVSSSLDQPVSLSLNSPNPFSVDTQSSQQSFTNIDPAAAASDLVYGSPGSFRTIYNQQAYEIELYLDAGGGATDNKKVQINPASVVYMNIEETLTDWSTRGTITLFYPNVGKAEPASKKTLGQSAETPTNVGGRAASGVENYMFRGDGYDVLRVRVSLLSEGSPTSFEVDESNPKWTISYLFSIYEIEDVMSLPGSRNEISGELKGYKLYFKDLRQHVLETTNMEFSTALLDQGDERSTEFAQQGLAFTGKTMLEILKKAFSLSPFGLDIGQLQLGDKWDEGKSKIFYTSPASETALEDLMYVYDQHISEGDDYAILTTERASNAKSIADLALIPVKDIFEKAGNGANAPGELQLEHFFLNAFSEDGEGGNPAEWSFKAPITDTATGDIDVKTFKYGMITAFSFVDMSPATNARDFRTAPVSSVDFSKRRFQVEFEDNSVFKARDKIVEEYIAPLYKKGSGTKLFTTVLDETKKDINVFPVFSLHGDNKIIRANQGLHKLLFTGLFHNTCIYFTTLGLPLRSPGSFIAIDKTQGSPEDDYSNKLYGQWLVLRVDHVFEGGLYYNNIYAVKIHRFDKLKEDFARTL